MYVAGIIVSTRAFSGTNGSVAEGRGAEAIPGKPVAQ